MAALIPVAEGRDGLRGQDKAALRTALDAAFGNSCTYLATVTETNLCLLIFTPGGSAAEQRRWLSDVLRVAMDKLNHSLRLPLRAGVGGIFGEFEKMAASYQQSLLALTGPTGGGVAFTSPRGGQGAAGARARRRRRLWPAWRARATCSASGPRRRGCSPCCGATGRLRGSSGRT